MSKYSTAKCFELVFSDSGVIPLPTEIQAEGGKITWESVPLDDANLSYSREYKFPDGSRLWTYYDFGKTQIEEIFDDEIIIEGL